MLYADKGKCPICGRKALKSGFCAFCDYDIGLIYRAVDDISRTLRVRNETLTDKEILNAVVKYIKEENDV